MIYSRLVSHHLIDASRTEVPFPAPALRSRVWVRRAAIHRPGREEGDGTAHGRTGTCQAVHKGFPGQKTWDEVTL